MATAFRSIAQMFRPVQATSMQQQNAPTIPAAGGSAVINEQKPADPMADLAALWQTDPNLKPVANPLATPLFNTDPKAIAAAASKLDFVSGLDPALVAKAMSGQDAAAFLQVLNTVGQKSLATGTQLNAATIETATSRNNERLLAAMPGQVKAITLDSMQSENPALQHPAAQPFLSLVRSQLQMKNPGMSAQDINNAAESALTGFATSLATPATATPSAASNDGGTNWAAWAGEK